jgi:hypothetical protein
MSDHRDEKLDRMLRARRIERPRADLAQRIILTARQRPQNKQLPLWQSVRDLFREFHLPKPAYVLASALIVGMVIGFNAPPDADLVTDDGGAAIQSFLSADEALL